MFSQLTTTVTYQATRSPHSLPSDILCFGQAALCAQHDSATTPAAPHSLQDVLRPAMLTSVTLSPASPDGGCCAACRRTLQMPPRMLWHRGTIGTITCVQ